MSSVVEGWLWPRMPATVATSVPPAIIRLVPEGMDVQLLRQAVLLENQLEAVGEGCGRHGEPHPLSTEQEVIICHLPLAIGFGDVCTFLPVLPQETFHLGGEVHIAITCAGLGFLDKDFLVHYYS